MIAVFITSNLFLDTFWDDSVSHTAQDGLEFTLILAGPELSIPQVCLELYTILLILLSRAEITDMNHHIWLNQPYTAFGPRAYLLSVIPNTLNLKSFQLQNS